MADRYFAAIGMSDGERQHIVEVVRADPAWQVRVDRSGLIVVTATETRSMPLSEDGLIIGTLHCAGRQAPLAACTPGEVVAITGSRGDHLGRAYWGHYVALFWGPDGSVDIVRAPLGALPCFTAKTDRGWIAGSDVMVMRWLGGYRAAIDWDALFRFAIAPDVRTRETCLVGLKEVRGGDRVRVTASASEETSLWSPWRFADPALRIDDPAEAARRVRETILSSMRTGMADVDRSLILLSGGLDSSIVSASAALLGLDARCVTVSTSVASGDERPFARKTAEAVGLPLHETTFDLTGVDLTHSEAALLPRPTARTFEGEGRRQARIVAQAMGATALLSGGGGDNIFCSLQSVAPAVDCLSELDDAREYWRITRELSQLTGTSLLTIARRALFRSWQPGRPYPKPGDTRFLDPAAATAVAAAAPRHAWLQRPSDIPQGKGAHVAALLGVQALSEDSDPQDPFALRYPLLAQPVVELCLRVPTWLWYDRGCNRAIARHGFSGTLPPEIAWRRSKGTPDGFVVEIYDARRAQIRKMLCEGHLAERVMLDLPRLKSELDDSRPVRGTDHGRIMRLLDIEAWARAWAG